jgi:hypothetical protein
MVAPQVGLLVIFSESSKACWSFGVPLKDADVEEIKEGLYIEV